MKVGYTQNGTIGNAPVKKKGASSTSGASFADFMSAAEAEETSSAGAAAPAGGLSSLIAVQEVGERPGGGRKRAARQASLTLDALDELRHALLMGEVPMHVLRTIGERIAQQKASVGDGPLLQVMKEIEVRAAVELAKLEQAPSPAR